MLTKYRLDTLPEWVRGAILLECPHCGAPIAQNENLTARWCPNVKCPGHMAYKLVDFAKFFNVKGIGPKTALNIIRSKKLESHIDIMKFWYPDSKPLQRLSVIASLAYIDGYGKVQAERDLDSYGSFADYFNNAQWINPLLRKNEELLLKVESYFTVMPPLSESFINVMATGSFNGYQSRDDYFTLLNVVFGEHLHIIQCGKRKTGVAFLLKEKETTDTSSKSAIAAERGIPVLTPMEFLLILCETFHIEDIKRRGEEFRQ